MPARPPFLVRQIARLMRYRWWRALLVRTSSAPEGQKYRDSVPSDAADGKLALVSGVKSVSLFVTDLERSRAFYETCVDLRHLATGEAEPHPDVPDRMVQVCALGFGETPDLFLARQTDSEGRVVPVTDNGLHHVAFWIESSTNIDDFAKGLRRRGVRLSYGPVKHYPGPGGDGGWGGNHAVYANDPDGHFLEFHNDMDPYGTVYELRGS